MGESPWELRNFCQLIEGFAFVFFFFFKKNLGLYVFTNRIVIWSPLTLHHNIMRIIHSTTITNKNCILTTEVNTPQGNKFHSQGRVICEEEQLHCKNT